MNLLKLTERTHTLQCCEHLMADLGCEDHQRALAASVDALRKHPPVAPPVVVGLFNQCMAHADSVIRAIARAPTSPALDAMDTLRRSLLRMQDSVDHLHAAAALRAGAAGRRTSVSSLPAPGALRTG
jgi:hypothetical protein